MSDDSTGTSGQSEKDRDRLTDDSIIDDQFDEFLSRLELLESEDYNGVDDEDLDYSIKERVMMIKLEKSVFDPLLSVIRTSRPVLYQGILQHPIIAGQQKSNRKQSKKEKKRDRKNEMKWEREKILMQSRTTRSQRRDKGGSGDSVGPIGTLADLRDSPERRAVSARETLAAAVAKTVAEGSMSGHLITVGLLLQILSTERAGANNNNSLSSLPIGNILAGLFERPDGDDESDTSDVAGVSSTQNSTGSSRDNPYLSNPFHEYLLSPRDEPAKSVAYSDMSRGDLGSIDESRTEESASQMGVGEGSVGYHGQHSDAGSTVGSTRAEQGTETASVDEEATEDEQLAQALAMSIRGTTANVSAENTLFEINMRVKAYSANSSAASAASSSGSVSFNRANQPPTTQTSPPLEPMSTYGPFSSPEFWRVLSSNEYPDHPGDIPMVSVRHTIIALLTVMRAASDKVLANDFSLSLLASPTPPTSIFEARQQPSSVYISHIPAVTPNTITFLLLDLLLDMLLSELKAHYMASTDEVSPRRASDESYSFEAANTPLTQILLKERERKGKQAIFATQESDGALTEEDIEAREWAFQRYFLLWSIASVLRLLRANLAVAGNTRFALTAVGLSPPVESDLSDTPIEPVAKPILRSTSFSGPITIDIAKSAPGLGLRLQQHVEACMALNLENTATVSLSRIVNLESILLPRKRRDDMCQRLLQSPSQSQQHPGSAASAHILSKNTHTGYPEQHSLVSYKHCLRIIAIDCFVSGLNVFRPYQSDRDSLLSYLLQNTPKPSDCYHPEYSPKLFGLSAEGSESNRAEGGLIYLLQEVCQVTAQTMSKARLSPSSSSSNLPHTQRSPLGVKAESSVSGESEGPPRSKILVGKGPIVRRLAVFDIEKILFSRLSGAGLMTVKEKEGSEGVGVVTSTEELINAPSTPGALVFGGELQLLHAIQQKYIKDFEQSTLGHVMYSPCQICFNMRRCHSDIAISGDNKVVTHRNSKVTSISIFVLFLCTNGVYGYREGTFPFLQCRHL